jgi:Ca2+-transporting ATPase
LGRELVAEQASVSPSNTSEGNAGLFVLKGTSMIREEHQQVGVWHLLEFQEVLKRLEVNPEHGLTHVEVKQRRDKHGFNELTGDRVEPGTENTLIVPWKRAMTPIVVILTFAAVGLLFLGEIKNAIPIIVIVALNVFLVIVQVYRTERATTALIERAALKKRGTPMTRVRRDGRLQSIPTCELVPGDIVLLEAGNLVAADARLLESSNLRVQEASLTGESFPVGKTPCVLSGQDILLGDRRNMVYKGTAVAHGCGTAVVVETGMRTELGYIAEMTQTTEAGKAAS